MSELSVAEVLAGVDAKPASYLAAARALAAGLRTGLAPIRVFALASFTFDVLVPYLVVECARRGLDVSVTAGPFGQLEQQVLDPSSPLWTSAPDVVIVAARVEELAPELIDDFLASRAEAAIDAYVVRVASLARSIRERGQARVVVWNQAPLRRLAAGLADAALETSQQHAIAELDRRLARTCAAVPGVVVLDIARLATELGTRQWFDARLQALARVPLSGPAQIAVGRLTARVLRAMRTPPGKCLVLDLDNTLWGGVLGEDGLAGLALGDDHPGSAFKAFQRALRGYRDRGVLLAIASKNNEADVAELFAGHRDMVLTREDFAATQIHWADKATSLRRIADELNLGLDALVFFDDNPVERAWIREQLPEVTVIEVPKDPLGYVDALDDSGAFDQLALTGEDRQRAAQYRSEVHRKDLERSAGSVDEFLRALDMRVTIGRIDQATLPRAVQLLGKTNQFNVTTRRHDEAQLARMLARDGTIALWMRAADRYGDHGLVAIAIAILDDDGYHLDSFLMSCRVLGRRLEHALVWSLVRRARARAGVLFGDFIPTKKNAPAAGFFADAGFTACAEPPNRWRLDVVAGVAAPSAFAINEES